MEKEKLEEMYSALMEYEQNTHMKNQKRIRIGLKCLWIIPFIFLFLLFATGSSKVIFLVLWILSLFGIAVYLIVVEYSDHNLQEKLANIRGEESEIDGLIAMDGFDQRTKAMANTVNRIENIKDETIEKQKEKIQNSKIKIRKVGGKIHEKHH